VPMRALPPPRAAQSDAAGRLARGGGRDAGGGASIGLPGRRPVLPEGLISMRPGHAPCLEGRPQGAVTTPVLRRPLPKSVLRGGSMLMRRIAAWAAAWTVVLSCWGEAATAQSASRAPATGRVPHKVSELVEICAIPSDSPEYTAASFFCRGFLAGAAQYHGALHPVGGARPPLFCAPDPPPTLLQAVNAFVAWARANPQHGSEAAVDGLVRFAQQTYPCPAGVRQTGRR
jgi:hypothetical protein